MTVPAADEQAIRATIDRLNATAAGDVPDQQAVLGLVVDPALSSALAGCGPATTTLRLEPVYPGFAGRPAAGDRRQSRCRHRLRATQPDPHLYRRPDHRDRPDNAAPRRQRRRGVPHTSVCQLNGAHPDASSGWRLGDFSCDTPAHLADLVIRSAHQARTPIRSVPLNSAWTRGDTPTDDRTGHAAGIGGKGGRTRAQHRTARGRAANVSESGKTATGHVMCHGTRKEVA